MKASELKFGDLVVNNWASTDNPGRVLMVWQSGPKYVRCIPRDGGTELRFRIDKDLRLTKVGAVDFGEWDLELITEKKKRNHNDN